MSVFDVERIVRVVAAPKFSAYSPWWIKLAWPRAEKHDGKTAGELVDALHSGPLKFASILLVRRYVDELANLGHLTLDKAKKSKRETYDADSIKIRIGDTEIDASDVEFSAKAAKRKRRFNVREKKRAALRIVCSVCGEPRDPQGCVSCEQEVPPSNDRRWPLWAAHLAKHPELRPLRGAAKVENVAGCWPARKIENVDAWSENASVEAPTIDEQAARRFFMPMD